jgi:alpha-tubulin suppressor-like RCC1 family protein
MTGPPTVCVVTLLIGAATSLLACGDLVGMTEWIADHPRDAGSGQRDVDGDSTAGSQQDAGAADAADPHDSTAAPMGCGDTKCSGSETQQTCCQDCRCPAGSVCRNATQSCVTPVDIAAGGRHTCALLLGGTVACWGYNEHGELGAGFSSLSMPTPTPIPGLTNVTALAAGSVFTCALVSEGTVRCWGDNTMGELGTGSCQASATPVQVSALDGVVKIAAGYDFACAIVSGGAVKCWGNNGAGQLGTAEPATSSAPLTVPNLRNATAIATGYGHACAVVDDGAVWCWGDNHWGQLGTGDTLSSSAPVQVVNLDGGASAVVTMFDRYPGAEPPSSDDHVGGATCALLSKGTVMCWGTNRFGELGRSSTSTFAVPRPDSVVNLTGAAALAGGSRTACAIVSNGNIVNCWGRNSSGEIGNGARPEDTGMVPSPTTVKDLTGAVRLAVGYLHACALLSDGSVKCWGSNAATELGAFPYQSSASPVALTW